MESPDETIANFDGQDEVNTEESLLKLYDAAHSDSPLAPGRRYRIVDPAGDIRTVSKDTRINRIKYHFEYNLPPEVSDAADESST